MGRCPEHYALIQAARYLDCKPWELMKESVVWQYWAHQGMNAESQAREQKEAMRKP